MVWNPSPDGAEVLERSQEAFLRAMAQRYVWDMTEADAVDRPERIVRRVMDIGVIEEALELEKVIGHERLVAILNTSPAGAMRPRSWWFWHYRLGLADAEHGPPLMPVRSLD